MTFLQSPVYGTWGWGALGQVPQQVEASPDPDAKAKAGDAMPRPFQWQGSPGARFPAFDKAPPGDDWLYWHMQRYSAVVLAMAAVVNPILAGTRTLEIRKQDGDEATAADQKPGLAGDSQDAPEDKLKRQLERHFEQLWPDILTGMEFVHWGRWTQEVVWDRVDGLIVPVEFNDFTPWEITLLRDPTGKLAGAKHQQEELDPQYLLHLVNLPHRNRLYGWPRAENAREDWWRAIQSRDNADRAERKASGISFLALVDPYYSFVDSAGNPVTGPQAVQTVYNSISGGGAAMAPRYTWRREDVKAKPELADIAPIKVEQYDWGDTGPAILASIQRLDALDKRIVRAYGRPEREMLEGQFGTKAEAGVHGDLGILDSEAVHNAVVRQVNAQAFNSLLVSNKGREWRDRLYWKAAQLTQADKAWKQAVAQALATAPGDELNQTLDRKALAKETELTIDKTVIPVPAMPATPADAGMPDGVGTNQPGGNGNGFVGRMAGVGT